MHITGRIIKNEFTHRRNNHISIGILNKAILNGWNYIQSLKGFFYLSEIIYFQARTCFNTSWLILAPQITITTFFPL